MAKGQMKSNKEVRKPKKDAKKPPLRRGKSGPGSQAEGQIGSLSARPPALARPGVLPDCSRQPISCAPCVPRSVRRAWP